MLSFYTKNIDWRQQFGPFVGFCWGDLHCYKALEAEIDLWETYWLNDTSYHPDSISSTLKSIDFNRFSNIKVCLRISGTLPVTTCTCERSFSFMRRLKTYTRSTMISERLNGIALMHAHQEIVPHIEKLIDLFAVTNRRVSFIWFLLVFNQYIVFALKFIFATITCTYFSDISELIYIIIEPFLMEQAQIFKLSYKMCTNVFASLLIIVINMSSYAEIPKFS